MIGIIAATQGEADELIALLGAGELCDEPFVTFGFKGGAIVISEMGLENAARATEYLIDEHLAAAVVNLGICGALSDDMQVGEVYRIVAVVDDDGGETACESNRWDDLPTAKLTSVSEPVFQPDRRAALAARADVVDMEGAAITAVCHARNVPCCMLKGVSDMADHTGKDDIKKNIAAVSAKIARVAAAGLDAPDSPTLLASVMNFTKIEHTVFSLPLLFSGAWLGAGRHWPGWDVLVLIALAGVGARCLGMAMNRILDRDLDAKNQRTANRELPAGRISLSGAWAIASAGLGVYLVACWALGPLCLMLSPVPAVPLIAYSLLKRFTNLCHFGIGLCLALAPLGAFIAASGSLALNTEVILLALFAFCWISGADIVYALMDIDSDRKTGVHSIPASLGTGGAQVVAAVVHLAAIACLVSLWLALGGGAGPGAAVAVSALALGAGYLQRIPVGVRFFPIFAIAGVSGSLVPLMGAAQ
ncbi:MAG: UbiA-like polyprenyltransferase [Phycisphaerae bacterium]|jgi:4-hydroxybenzoate polyprenyltransferase|nr:UbiA-like polyprenyltransferase [Phycisphaerae bacterium]